MKRGGNVTFAHKRGRGQGSSRPRASEAKKKAPNEKAKSTKPTAKTSGTLFAQCDGFVALGEENARHRKTVNFCQTQREAFQQHIEYLEQQLDNNPRDLEDHKKLIQLADEYAHGSYPQELDAIATEMKRIQKTSLEVKEVLDLYRQLDTAELSTEVRVKFDEAKEQCESALRDLLHGEGGLARTDVDSVDSPMSEISKECAELKVKNQHLEKLVDEKNAEIEQMRKERDE
ncbi:hypothetical protein CC86DRAFT_371343 [Ophiobolus disseminans]|uniref:Uncharacterized protein n=1 Tax=Ophiobolus disseminans TaxID=1469910 RepID=A0A6A6ZUT3_9PLEO|nr:hypothetical protein CC86DRAFT_371343 [Ophiobolus disseminans]